MSEEQVASAEIAAEAVTCTAEEIDKKLQADFLWELPEVRASVKRFKEKYGVDSNRDGIAKLNKLTAYQYVGLVLLPVFRNLGAVSAIAKQLKNGESIHRFYTPVSELKGDFNETAASVLQADSNVSSDSGDVEKSSTPDLPVVEADLGWSQLRSINIPMDESVVGNEEEFVKTYPNQEFTYQNNLPVHDKKVVISKLGAGGFCNVYLVLYKGQLLVEKILSEPDKDDNALRFLAEMRAQKALNGEADVPRYISAHKVYDPVTKKQHPAFYMEYIPGHTLRDLLNVRGTISWKYIVDIGQQVAEKMDRVHSFVGHSPDEVVGITDGVIHRDIKPENLLITADNTTTVFDFGLTQMSKILEQKTRENKLPGTVPYMAPEQLNGQSTKKTDVWSLGITMYECITGHCPFKADTAMKSILGIQNFGTGKEGDLHKTMQEALRGAHAPNELIDLILNKMLCPETGARPAMYQVADDLNNLRPQLHGKFTSIADKQLAPELQTTLSTGVPEVPNGLKMYRRRIKIYDELDTVDSPAEQDERTGESENSPFIGTAEVASFDSYSIYGESQFEKELFEVNEEAAAASQVDIGNIRAAIASRVQNVLEGDVRVNLFERKTNRGATASFQKTGDLLVSANVDMVTDTDSNALTKTKEMVVAVSGGRHDTVTLTAGFANQVQDFQQRYPAKGRAPLEFEKPDETDDKVSVSVDQVAYTVSAQQFLTAVRALELLKVVGSVERSAEAVEKEQTENQNRTEINRLRRLFLGIIVSFVAIGAPLGVIQYQKSVAIESANKDLDKATSKLLTLLTSPKMSSMEEIQNAVTEFNLAYANAEDTVKVAQKNALSGAQNYYLLQYNSEGIQNAIPQVEVLMDQLQESAKSLVKSLNTNSENTDELFITLNLLLEKISTVQYGDIVTANKVVAQTLEDEAEGYKWKNGKLVDILMDKFVIANSGFNDALKVADGVTDPSVQASLEALNQSLISVQKYRTIDVGPKSKYFSGIPDYCVLDTNENGNLVLRNKVDTLTDGTTVHYSSIGKIFRGKDGIEEMQFHGANEHDGFSKKWDVCLEDSEGWKANVYFVVGKTEFSKFKNAVPSGFDPDLHKNSFIWFWSFSHENESITFSHDMGFIYNQFGDPENGEPDTTTIINSPAEVEKYPQVLAFMKTMKEHDFSNLELRFSPNTKYKTKIDTNNVRTNVDLFVNSNGFCGDNQALRGKVDK